MSPSLSGVAASGRRTQLVGIEASKVFPGDRAGPRRGGQNPEKRDPGTHVVEQLGPYARHTVEPLEAPERAMLRAPGHDALRQGRSDARQSRDLGHVGAVQIDASPGASGRASLGGAARGLGADRTGRASGDWS